MISIVPIAMGDLFFDKDGFLYMTEDFDNNGFAFNFEAGLVNSGEIARPTHASDDALLIDQDEEQPQQGGFTPREELTQISPAFFAKEPILAIGQRVTPEVVQRLTDTCEAKIDAYVEAYVEGLVTSEVLGGEPEIIYFGFDRLLAWTSKGAPFVRGASDLIYALGYIAYDVVDDAGSRSMVEHVFLDWDTGEIF